MKNCPSCGRRVPESKRFCSHCGEKLSETEGLQTEALSAEGDIRAAVVEPTCPSCGERCRMSLLNSAGTAVQPLGRRFLPFLNPPRRHSPRLALRRTCSFG